MNRFDQYLDIEIDEKNRFRVYVSSPCNDDDDYDDDGDEVKRQNSTMRIIFLMSSNFYYLSWN